MPNPAQSDLHVNVPLTNVSVAYMQSPNDFIATKVFPKVPVQKQSDLFWKYSKSDWRRTDVKKRAPGTESSGSGWKYDTDSYFAHVYATHKDIDDQIRSNADSNFNLEADATKFITNQMLISRDLDWCNQNFKTGVWGTEYTGVSGTPGASQFKQWSDDASDPIRNVADWMVDFRLSTGLTPSVAVFGADVMKALKNHPDLIDRIKFTQRGVVTEELVASLLGLKKILVAYASYTDVAQMNDAADQDAAADYSFIADRKSAALYYVPDSPSLMTPAAGYTFTWNGYLAGNAEGIKIKRFRQEAIASDRVEAEMTYDMKVVAEDCGIFLNTVVA